MLENPSSDYIPNIHKDFEVGDWILLVTGKKYKIHKILDTGIILDSMNFGIPISMRFVQISFHQLDFATNLTLQQSQSMDKIGDDLLKLLQKNFKHVTIL